MKNRILFVFLIFCCVQLFWRLEVFGQSCPPTIPSSCDRTLNASNVIPGSIGSGDVVCLGSNRSNDIDLKNINDLTLYIQPGILFTGNFLNVGNNVRIINAGTYTKTWTLSATGANFENTGTFNGGLTLQNNANYVNSGNSNSTVTNDNTAIGSYTNCGTQSGNTTLNGPSSSYIITSSGNQNNGTVIINNGSFINQGTNSRTTTLANSSTFVNSGTQSGTVTINNSSSYTNSSVTSSNVTVDGTSAIYTITTSGNQTNGSVLVTNGSFINQGTNSRSTTLANSSTFVNSGTQSGQVTLANSSSYTNSGTQSNSVSIAGTANYSNSASHTGNVSLTTNGSYNNSGIQIGNLTINNGTSVTNSGTLNLTSLNFDTNNSGMTFNNTSTSVLNVTNSTTMSGTVTLNGTSTFSNNLTFTTNNGLTNVAISENANLLVSGTLSLARNSNVDITNPSNFSPGPIINANSLTFPNDGGSSIRQLNIGANSTVTIALDTDVDTGNAQINLQGTLETRDLLIRNNGSASPTRLVMSGDSELIVNRDAIINRDISATDNAQISITRDLNLENNGSYSLALSGNISLDVGGNTTLNKPMYVSGTSSVNLAGDLTLPNTSSELVINDDVNFYVGGNTSVESPIRMNDNAYVTFIGNVNLPNVGNAIFEANDNADVLITGNLTKSLTTSVVDVNNTSQLVICNERMPSGTVSGGYPTDTETDNIFVSASPAYYGGCRILPVEFLYFSAIYQSHDHLASLKWSTGKEWENSHFEIERTIGSIKEWETVGRVEGNGYSDGPIEYTFKDQSLPWSGGYIFYRIKQVDFDGSFIFSTIKSINLPLLNSANSWKIYPNPSSGIDFNIRLINSDNYLDGQIKVRVSSILGISKTFVGNQISEISPEVGQYLNSLNKGLYTVEVIWDNQIEYHKVIRN